MAKTSAISKQWLAEASIADLEARLQEPAMAKNRVARAQIKKTLTQRAKDPKNGLPVMSAEDAALRPVPPQEVAPVSAGDTNLLTETVSITRNPFAEIILGLSRSFVQTVQGTEPIEMVVQSVRNSFNSNSQDLRLVVKWRVPRFLSPQELYAISTQVHAAYEENIQALKSNGKSWQKIGLYENAAGVAEKAQQGVYFGPDWRYCAGSRGVLVYRKFAFAADAKSLQAHHPLDWLSQPAPKSKGGPKVDGSGNAETFIELRDGGRTKVCDGLEQDSFIALVAQISSILAHSKSIPSQALMASIYRALNRVGTHEISRDMLFGMKPVLAVTERTILLPFEQPERAKRLRIPAESVLLVGVPGIGKTSLAHYLMMGEYNVIFAAVDTDALRGDLMKASKGEESTILAKIDRIRRRCGLVVVLIIDDIDVILNDEDDEMVSKVLNMMRGIREKGLHLLASTNYPEEIDVRLLEPGRLSRVIHVRLPELADRKGVLATHFKDRPIDGNLEAIIDWAAGQTQGWTQRYLWELVTEASRICCVTTPDDKEPAISLEHVKAGLADIEGRVNFKKLADWDDEIAKFVSSAGRKYGFSTEHLH